MRIKKHRELVTFDWALKRLLRSKANYKVLEGFLSVLLHDDIRIVEILESESNKETEQDKFNRVDLLVKDRIGRHIIIEVQYSREDDYLQRMMYGTAKVLTESLSQGKNYREIARVVSVNIVHFDLGHGEDYIYEGRTEFCGVHRHDRLDLTEMQRELFQAETVQDLFPEYYILKVNNFDDRAKDALDQWVYFLKNGSIKPGFDAKGLQEAQAAMDVLKLTAAEKRSYDLFVKTQRIQRGVAESTVLRAERAERGEANAKARLEQAEANAKAQVERALAAKDEALAEKDAALQKTLAALIATGLSEAQAKKILAG
jgi:predicted transposase/invertase (TIGR01784 family)